ncbi:MAG: MotA/TolQ/ExbB proton channel family protein [Methylophilus sp.]|uniref:MotA/TolQ/ExbB proton channel family protein n=1 Tax=Methylophilus sp. TaxID=29541 RepID=UPI003FA06688
MESTSGLAFITEGGVVSVIVALILLTMSVLSWYFVVVKSWQVLKHKREVSAYVSQFWRKATLQEALQESKLPSPAYRLALTAVESTQHHQQYAAQSLGAACSQDEFIARQLRRTLSQEQATLDSGLSVLASVGSVAPFVGLFGTVWGIYHALTAIGQSGVATIDKVAGPVGEALIMTAIGLAVAIPAVLAYNAFIKANRVIMAELESFAQDLHTLLTTGAPLMIKLGSKSANVTDIHARVVNKGGNS